MRRSSPHDFSVATRQSYAAILIIMYRLYKVLIRQLFPLLLIVFIQGDLSKSKWFVYPVIVIAVLGAIYSILAFFRYYFFIENETLVVKKGVFRRTTLEMPFDRIQSINFEQNLIHRLFSVVRLNMDTAGSSGNELELYALDRHKATQLSDVILSNKKAVERQRPDESETDQSEKRHLIFRLSLWQLLKVGVTENHIRSGGVIIFFIFYLWDSLEDIGIDLVERGEQYVPVARQLVQSLAVVFILILLFALIAFIISLVRTVLNYYDLQMYRKGKGFVVVSGLLNKKEKAARDEKVQIIKASQNLLQSWTHIYELIFRQASSAQVSESKSIKVVGLSRDNLDEAERYLLKSRYEESRNVGLSQVDFYFLYKRLYYWSLALLAAGSFFVYFNRIDNLVYSMVIYALGVFASLLAYRKKKYGFGPHVFRIDGGVFGRTRQVLENHKIQSIHLRETPFQKRRGLATLVLYTASGSLTVPHIPKTEAMKMNNYLLYKVESSRKKWM